MSSKKKQNELRLKVRREFIGANLLVLTLAILLWEPTMIGQIPWNWGTAILFVQILYVGLSLKSVGPTDFGAVLLFGKPIYPINSGLNLVPWKLSKAIVVTKNIIQIVIGTPQTNREDKPVSIEDETGLATILRDEEPFRVTTADISDLPNASPEEKASLNPLHKTLTVDPLVILTFRVKDVLLFLENIGSLEQLMKISSQTARGVLQRVAGQNTLARILGNLHDITQEIGNAMEERLGEKKPDEKKTKGGKENLPDCGINFMTAMIASLGINHDTNKKIAENVQAGFKASTVAKESEGDATRIRNLGNATAGAEKALLTARAAGVKLLGESASTPGGAHALSIEGLREAVARGNVTILPADLGILTGASAIAEALRQQGVVRVKPNQ